MLALNVSMQLFCSFQFISSSSVSPVFDYCNDKAPDCWIFHEYLKWKALYCMVNGQLYSRVLVTYTNKKVATFRFCCWQILLFVCLTWKKFTSLFFYFLGGQKNKVVQRQHDLVLTLFEIHHNNHGFHSLHVVLFLCDNIKGQTKI